MAASLDKTQHPHLPLIIAGPILRKVTASEVNIWLVTTKPLEGFIEINDANSATSYHTEDFESSLNFRLVSKLGFVYCH